MVDSTGRVLACTDPNRHQLGEYTDTLELATLRAMQEEPYGTVIGSGNPSKEVSGSLFILLILLFIRLVTARTVSSIRGVSSAAENIARGHYS